MSVLSEIKALQDQIIALESSANDLESQAEEAREKAKELKAKVNLAIRCLDEMEEDRMKVRNDMEAKLNNIYLDVLTNPDPSGFRAHIEEFAAAFSIALAKEEDEEETDAA